MKKAYKGLIVVALVGACAGVAQASTWVGGGIDNEYSTTNNWNDGLINGTQDINGNWVVERVVDSTAQRTFIRGGAVLNVTGGIHNDNRSGSSIYNFIGGGSVGTVNQSAGSYSIGHSLRIGNGNDNSDGTWNHTGGDLIVYRGSNSSIDSSNPGGRPSMEVGNNSSSAGTGLFEISAGSLATRGGVHVGNGGTFSVVGSDATSIGIGSNQDSDGLWLQTSNATLRASIDAGGLTPIFIDDVDADMGVFAEFRDGSLLDLAFDGIAPIDGTWTVMEVEGTGITDLGLDLAGTTAAGWSFNVDNSGANGLLLATYVIPEPATLGMIAVFGGGMLYIRRRFMV